MLPVLFTIFMIWGWRNIDIQLKRAKKRIILSKKGESTEKERACAS